MNRNRRSRESVEAIDDTHQAVEGDAAHPVEVADQSERSRHPAVNGRLESAGLRS